ncbi:MAG: ABC transporter permease subunit [Chloroflexota bacterium]|nr:ABC transporter permease subunit [Chloroflexota bacterium]
MIGALFWLSMRQAASPKRLLLLSVVSLLPVGLSALLVALDEADIEGIVGGGFEPLVISFILPLVVIVLASGSFGNEVEDRTLSLLTTKPVPRWSLVLAKLLGTIVVAAPMMAAVAVAMTALAPDRETGIIVAAAVGAVVGVVVYASVFTWAGMVTTRALAFGLVYVMLWEALITSFLSGTRYLSVRSYTIGVMHGMEGSPFSETLALGYQASIVGAVVVTVLFFALAVRRLSRMDVP